MRLALSIVAATACQREPPAPTPTPAPAPVTSDDTCDPATPKVCMGQDVVACEPDGHLGRRLRACHTGCSGGACQNTCDDAALELIYVVDTANDLLSFDPRKLPKDPFHMIGKLCGGHEKGPWSMAVDRKGVAWVNFFDGELRKVSIADASCTPSGYVPSSVGAQNFGMGFVSDTKGGDSETLYLAAASDSRALIALDPTHDLAHHRVGTLTATDARHPELTGTSAARLFGFYPTLSERAFVQEIDRTTAHPIGRKLELGAQTAGTVSAYAFAQWGGTFYVFASLADDSGSLNSTVQTVSPSGETHTVMSHLPYVISGAGVSTCAPERDEPVIR